MTLLRDLCDEQLAILDGESRTYAEKTAAVRSMLVACESALADPSLSNLRVAADLRQAAMVALERLRNSIYAARSRALGSNVHPRTYLVRGNEPMAAWQIAKELFGDATRWPDLLNGNAITNVNAIKPGTVLNILSS